MKDRWRLALGAIVAAVVMAAGGCAIPDDPVLGSEASALVVDQTAVPFRSSWSYWDRGGDLGVAWRLPAYDDSAWASGQGPLGYGESYLSTVVGYGPDATNRYITTYFRTDFTVEDPDAVVAMVGRLMYDDGAVVYLNGQEIQRQGVPAPSTAQTLASGHEIGNAYESFDWTAHRAKLVAGVNTFAVEVHQAGKTSSDLTFDLAMEMEVEVAPEPTEGGIPRRSEWTYWDRGGDLGSAWRTPAYDDSAWAIGAGPLGYGENYVQTYVGYGPDASTKHITTYFRADFIVDDLDRVASMTGGLMYDDGLVVYLNGHEIGRQGVAAPSTASTRASGHEAGNTYETFNWSAQIPHLVEGVNTIAVEVHQQAASSSDLVFDLDLTLVWGPPPPPPPPPAAPAEDTPRGATWSYWDRGGDLGTAWRARAFDDAAWASGAGPLGYGEAYLATTVGYGGNASNKHITTYFRRHFTINDPLAVVSVRVEVLYDDGVVIYLNGTEIKRLHMPAGPITAATLAPGWETGNAYETYELGTTGLLVEGDNVIAVEVHQAQRTSSDLAFDMSITIDSTCAQASNGGWIGTVGKGNFGSGGSEQDRADVTWTLSRTDGCVDHYTPSGTAYLLRSAHYCYEVEPASAPIEAGDGELIIDRSTTPATYTIRGRSEWPGFSGCSDPDDENYGWNATTLGSNWATALRGSFDRDVMGGGLRGDPGAVDWFFRDAGVSFPPPAAGACVEPSSAQWRTVTTTASSHAEITWTRSETNGCFDTYLPSGTFTIGPIVDDSPGAFCRTRTYSPDTAAIDSDDGYLVIDRSVNPPAFDITGGTRWIADETCTRPDGSVQTANDYYGGSWAGYDGQFHGDRFTGGFGTGSEARDWAFDRQ